MNLLAGRNNAAMSNVCLLHLDAHIRLNFGLMWVCLLFAVGIDVGNSFMILNNTLKNKIVNLFYFLGCIGICIGCMLQSDSRRIKLLRDLQELVDNRIELDRDNARLTISQRRDLRHFKKMKKQVVIWVEELKNEEIQ